MIDLFKTDFERFTREVEELIRLVDARDAARGTWKEYPAKCALEQKRKRLRDWLQGGEKYVEQTVLRRLKDRPLPKGKK